MMPVSRWGTVAENRPKQPEVFVSLTRGDTAAIRMVAGWMGLSVEKLEEMIQARREQAAS